MAKGSGKKSVTVEVNAVQAQPKTAGAEQTREDVSDLMRPMMLRQDKARHKRAVDAISKTLDHEMGRLKVPRAKARAGRRTSARNIGKR